MQCLRERAKLVFCLFFLSFVGGGITLGAFFLFFDITFLFSDPPLDISFHQLVKTLQENKDDALTDDSFLEERWTR